MYLTDHLDLWDTTATHTVASDDWREVKRVYVDDSLDVGMDRFFDRYNPHAQQVLLGNLLGAASRGQWDASAADKAQVAGRLARSVAAHGIACEANMCRNPALTRQIAEALEGTADGAALLDGYTRALREATAPATETSATTAASSGNTSHRVGRTAPGQGSASAAVARAARAAGASASVVTGRVMETVAQSAAPRPPRSISHGDLTEWLLLAAISTICVILGWLRQARLTS